jgi:hypothetical protein
MSSLDRRHYPGFGVGVVFELLRLNSCQSLYIYSQKRLFQTQDWFRSVTELSFSWRAGCVCGRGDAEEGGSDIFLSSQTD